MAPSKTGSAVGASSKKRKATEAVDDFVYTIYSDDDVAPPTKKGRVEESDDSAGDDDDLDSDFRWDDGNDAQDFDDIEGWNFNDAKQAIPAAAAADPERVNLESIIQSKKKDKVVATDNPEADKVDIDMDDGDDEVLADDAFGMNVGSDDEDTDADAEVTNLGSEEGDASDNDSIATPVAHPDDLDDPSDSGDNSEDDAEELAKQKAFFAPEEKLKAGNGNLNSFLNMNLSRQILRGITAAGYVKPTPVQSKTIPMALNGKDIVGSAITGSGKTAAFLVPILERLLYRDTRTPQTRVVILTPTRELAIQCHDVAKKLATHTNIKFCLAVGGLSSKVQEAELRLRPDVVIGTPGRFIDHMRNSLGFAVDKVEILVLDEADRMLEDGFQDELNEILETLPKSRQTMLFSATMNSSVDRLIAVGLRKPHRIMIDSQKQTAGTLVQQFAKLKARNEDKRMGYLVYLCKKLFTTRTIVFFKEKKLAHRARIIFGLLDMSCAELHGSMKQSQRIASVEAFRDGKASFLLASDVAARGLDIKGVDVVINYEPPSSQEIYLHRVGRTARAGRKGVACTLYSQSERKIVKAVVKEGKSRGAKMEVPAVDVDAASKWQEQIDKLEDTIEDILEEEKIQKRLAQVEMEATKAENMIKHEDEIKSRPKRTWFQSEKEKQLAAAAEKAKSAKPVDSVDKLRAKLKSKSNGKLSNKDKKRLDAKAIRKEGTLSRGQLNKDGKPGAKTGPGNAGKGKGKGKGPKNKR